MPSSPYRTQQPLNVADLEGRLPLILPCTKLRNELLIPMEGKIAVYVGLASNLETSGPVNEYASMKGYGWLFRFDRTEKSKKELIRWFPPKYEIKTSLEDKKIWEIKGFHHFLWNGELNSDYKGFLKKEALKEGVTVSDKLLDLVFGPIEAQILEMYHDLRKKLNAATV